MPTKSPSRPFSQRVPIPNEVYDFVDRYRSADIVSNRLLCSKTLAQKLKRRDRSARITPLELDSIQRQIRRINRLSPENTLCGSFMNPTKEQKKHLEMLRAVVLFVTTYKPQLREYRRRQRHPATVGNTEWSRPVHLLTLLLLDEVIPHLKKMWYTYPEFRDVFFGDTGFEKVWIRPRDRKRQLRKTLKARKDGPSQ